MTGEQVAASLVTVGQRAIGWLAGLPQKALHTVLCAVLLLWLLYQLGQLVSLFLPQSPPETLPDVAPANASPDLSNKAKSVPIGQLQALNLFGIAGAQPIPVAAVSIVEEVEINATKTGLNISLEGIVHTPVVSGSLAMIVYQNKQDQYYVGDKLPVGNQVVLSRILMDHVILDNNGRYESLWLYDDEKKKFSATASRVSKRPRQASVMDKREDEGATLLAQNYRERLYKNPASLAEVLRISPAQQAGEMVGYRVSPGKDRQQFSRLGFQANDIVTGINDIELDEPSRALEIYKLMRTAREASFTVLRNGETVYIMVSLNDT